MTTEPTSAGENARRFRDAGAGRDPRCLRARSAGFFWVAFVLACGATPVAGLDGESEGIGVFNRHFAGQPHDIVLSDSVAFVGLDTGIGSVSIVRPDAPVLLDYLYLPAPALKLRVSNGILYAACGEAGLQIVDARNPSDLLLAGFFPIVGARAVDVRAGTAYVAEAGGPTAAVPGVRIVDVSVASAPAELGFLPLPNGVLDVELSGNILLAGLGSSPNRFHGLVAVDISNPRAPFVTGNLETAAPVHDIVANGTGAFLGMGFSLSGRVAAVDLSNPASPVVASSVLIPDTACSLVLEGSRLLVAARRLGLMVIDSSQPSSLRLLGSMPTGRDTRAVAADSAFIFLAERGYNEEGSFTVVPAGDPGTLAVAATMPYSEAVDAAVENGTAYLLNRDGLHIFDAANPGIMREIGAWAQFGADLSGLAVSGGLAAVGEGSAIHLLDVRDPAAPSFIGDVALNTDGAVVVRPVISGNTLFAVIGQGLEAFDISSPLSPVFLGCYPTVGYASGLYVDGSTGYLAAGSRLLILDLSAPGSPSLLGTFDGDTAFYAVTVMNGLAALTGLERLLTLVDVSTPSSPVGLGEIQGYTGFDVAFTGIDALVAAGADGVVAVNVLDPASPWIVGFYDTSGEASALAADEATVLLGCGAGQHWALNCFVCGPSCTVSARVEPSQPVSVCEGTEVLLDGGGSMVSGCPGSLRYQWYEDGGILDGAIGSTYEVPVSHATGRFVFRLVASCRPDASCWDFAEEEVDILQETWPSVTVNSLRVSRTPEQDTFSWASDSATGDFDLHGTVAKADLPGLHGAPGTLAATSDQLSLIQGGGPAPGAVEYFKVYGRNSCTGASVP